MIRTDVWSVKVWDSAIEPAGFVHTRMFRTLEAASRWSKNNPHREGIRNIIVHPIKEAVELYVALGNTID